MPESTLEALASDPEQLKAVLTHHAVAKRLPASRVVRRTRIKTVNGESIRVRVRNGTVRLDRTARVTKVNVRASNGYIHVINRVLLPPS